MLLLNGRRRLLESMVGDACLNCLLLCLMLLLGANHTTIIVHERVHIILYAGFILTIIVLIVGQVLVEKLLGPRRHHTRLIPSVELLLLLSDSSILLLLSLSGCELLLLLNLLLLHALLRLLVILLLHLHDVTFVAARSG